MQGFSFILSEEGFHAFTQSRCRGRYYRCLQDRKLFVVCRLLASGWRLLFPILSTSMTWWLLYLPSGARSCDLQTHRPLLLDCFPRAFRTWDGSAGDSLPVENMLFIKLNCWLVTILLYWDQGCRLQYLLKCSPVFSYPFLYQLWSMVFGNSRETIICLSTSQREELETFWLNCVCWR